MRVPSPWGRMAFVIETDASGLRRATSTTVVSRRAEWQEVCSEPRQPATEVRRAIDPPATRGTARAKRQRPFLAFNSRRTGGPEGPHDRRQCASWRTPPKLPEARRTRVDTADPQTDVAPGGTPEPQCAFKMSMLNVVCNSH